MVRYVLICGNCGTENRRPYLPQKFLCSECGEGSLTDEWREEKVIRCMDNAHRAERYSNIGPRFCPNAKSMRFFEGKGILYPDGRSINWLRVCDLSDKVVVHNKICDCDYTPPRRDDIVE